MYHIKLIRLSVKLLMKSIDGRCHIARKCQNQAFLSKYLSRENTKSKEFPK